METPEEQPLEQEPSRGGIGWGTILVIVLGVAAAIAIPVFYGGSSASASSAPASSPAAPEPTAGGETGDTGAKQANAELYDLHTLGKILDQQSGKSSRNRYAQVFLRVYFGAEKDKYAREENCLKKALKFSFCVRAGDDASALATQVSEVCDLRDTDQDLAMWLEGFNDHFHDVLRSNGMPEVAFAGCVDFAHHRLHIDLETNRWIARHQQAKDAIVRFDFLQKNWGKWQIKDGAVVFQDDALRAAHDQMQQVLRDDAKNVEITYKAFMDDFPYKLVEPDDVPSS